MRYIKSCGFVAYKRTENVNYYLIIKSPNGDIGFPKGHMEDGESEIDTAHRELKEETGVEVEVIDGFRRQIEYPLRRVPDAVKRVIYFLGRCTNDGIVCQEGEVLEAEFVPYAKAVEMLTFNEMKDILHDAEEFLSRRL